MSRAEFVSSLSLNTEYSEDLFYVEMGMYHGKTSVNKIKL